MNIPLFSRITEEDLEEDIGHSYESMNYSTPIKYPKRTSSILSPGPEYDPTSPSDGELPPVKRSSWISPRSRRKEKTAKRLSAVASLRRLSSEPPADVMRVDDHSPSRGRGRDKDKDNLRTVGSRKNYINLIANENPKGSFR
jgi:hypothetical protein